MQQDKKQKWLFLLLILSMLLNVALTYFLFDNSITYSYSEQSKGQLERQKNDSLEFLNLVLKHAGKQDFQKAQHSFLNNTDRLYKPEEDGYMVIGELCFKNINNQYKASYCTAIDNPIPK